MGRPCHREWGRALLVRGQRAARTCAAGEHRRVRACRARLEGVWMGHLVVQEGHAGRVSLCQAAPGRGVGAAVGEACSCPAEGTRERGLGSAAGNAEEPSDRKRILEVAMAVFAHGLTV